MGRKHCNLQCFGASCLARKLGPLLEYEHCNLRCFGVKWLGKKAWAFGAIWVEDTVIYSVLEQVVWQEGSNHCCNMCSKNSNLQCFRASCLARRLQPLLQHG